MQRIYLLPGGLRCPKRLYNTAGYAVLELDEIQAVDRYFGMVQPVALWSVTLWIFRMKAIEEKEDIVKKAILPHRFPRGYAGSVKVKARHRWLVGKIA